MGYRDNEKEKYAKRKGQLFSEAACREGMYNKRLRDFCLEASCAAENLHESIREAALAYFGARCIPWHHGHRRYRNKDLPSNHLCCSQSACVNAWFPFHSTPEPLKAVLSALGYNVKEVLRVEADAIVEMKRRGITASETHWSGGNEAGYVAFEWIGCRNYLGERSWGSRGANATSLDFAFRLRRNDGCIEVVLGEWKYTECYQSGKEMRFSASGFDRATTYAPHIRKPSCQIVLPEGLDPEDLMYDPFDQMMRAQLLASAMEEAHEMGADVVSYLHIAPEANTELTCRITSPALTKYGTTIHDVWNRLIRPPDRFKHVSSEQLLPILLTNAPDRAWASWMGLRYSC